MQRATPVAQIYLMYESNFSQHYLKILDYVQYIPQKCLLFAKPWP